MQNLTTDPTTPNPTDHKSMTSATNQPISIRKLEMKNSIINTSTITEPEKLRILKYMEDTKNLDYHSRPRPRPLSPSSFSTSPAVCASSLHYPAFCYAYPPVPYSSHPTTTSSSSCTSFVSSLHRGTGIVEEESTLASRMKAVERVIRKRENAGKEVEKEKGWAERLEMRALKIKEEMERRDERERRHVEIFWGRLRGGGEGRDLIGSEVEEETEGEGNREQVDMERCGGRGEGEDQGQGTKRKRGEDSEGEAVKSQKVSGEDQ